MIRGSGFEITDKGFGFPEALHTEQTIRVSGFETQKRYPETEWFRMWGFGIRVAGFEFRIQGSAVRESR